MLLYMHIPFCDSKCHYCAFNSYTDRFGLREAYMGALHTQLRHDLNRFASKGGIETLFIGGGTPSTVSAKLYAPLFKTLAPYLADDAEITAEANPKSATSAWLEGMRELGVNRLSLGVQSFFDDKLAFLGRSHRADDAESAILRAEKAGFGRINADLIYATALDTPKRLKQEIAALCALPVEHVSAYELTLEANTPFADRPEVRNASAKQARLVAEQLESAGFKRYEVSNFGIPCRHNLGYWRQRPYLGVGAGAVGFVNQSRYYPHADPATYIADPLARRVESLSADDLLEEHLFLGLRSNVGIAIERLNTAMRRRCELLSQEGKLKKERTRYRNPDLLLADEIALFILG